jgi:hypothetical protein
MGERSSRACWRRRKPIERAEPRRVPVFELRRSVFVLQSRGPEGSRRVSRMERRISVGPTRTPKMKGRVSVRQNGISEGKDGLFLLQSRIFELRSSVFALRRGISGRSRRVLEWKPRGSRAQSGLCERERHARQARQGVPGAESARDRRQGGSLERGKSTSGALAPRARIRRRTPPFPRPPPDRGPERCRRDDARPPAR